MRVYEFAKKLGIPTKKLLTELQNGGFSVASHMSVLDEKAMAFLENLFLPGATPNIKEPTIKESNKVQKRANYRTQNTRKKNSATWCRYKSGSSCYAADSS